LVWVTTPSQLPQFPLQTIPATTNPVHQYCVTFPKCLERGEIERIEALESKAEHMDFSEAEVTSKLPKKKKFKAPESDEDESPKKMKSKAPESDDESPPPKKKKSKAPESDEDKSPKKQKSKSPESDEDESPPPKKKKVQAEPASKGTNTAKTSE